MNWPLFMKVVGQLTMFVVAVTVLWLLYTAIHHAKATSWSFKDWVSDLASVNTRMTVALGLFVTTIIVLLAAVVINAGGVFRADLDKETIRYILLAEFGAMGWDVIGFIGKRVTYKPGSPDDRGDSAPPPPTPPVPPVTPQPDQLISPNLTNFTPRAPFTPVEGA